MEVKEKIGNLSDIGKDIPDIPTQTPTEITPPEKEEGSFVPSKTELNKIQRPTLGEYIDDSLQQRVLRTDKAIAPDLSSFGSFIRSVTNSEYVIPAFHKAESIFDKMNENGDKDLDEVFNGNAVMALRNNPDFAGVNQKYLNKFRFDKKPEFNKKTGKIKSMVPDSMKLFYVAAAYDEEFRNTFFNESYLEGVGELFKDTVSNIEQDKEKAGLGTMIAGELISGILPVTNAERGIMAASFGLGMIPGIAAKLSPLVANALSKVPTGQKIMAWGGAEATLTAGGYYGTGAAEEEQSTLKAQLSPTKENEQYIDSVATERKFEVGLSGVLGAGFPAVGYGLRAFSRRNLEVNERMIHDLELQDFWTGNTDFRDELIMSYREGRALQKLTDLETSGKRRDEEIAKIFRSTPALLRGKTIEDLTRLKAIPTGALNKLKSLNFSDDEVMTLVYEMRDDLPVVVNGINKLPEELRMEVFRKFRDENGNMHYGIIEKIRTEMELNNPNFVEDLDEFINLVKEVEKITTELKIEEGTPPVKIIEHTSVAYTRLSREAKREQMEAKKKLKNLEKAKREGVKFDDRNAKQRQKEANERARDVTKHRKTLESLLKQADKQIEADAKQRYQDANARALAVVKQKKFVREMIADAEKGIDVDAQQRYKDANERVKEVVKQAKFIRALVDKLERQAARDENYLEAKAAKAQKEAEAAEAQAQKAKEAEMKKGNAEEIKRAKAETKRLNDIAKQRMREANERAKEVIAQRKSTDKILKQLGRQEAEEAPLAKTKVKEVVYHGSENFEGDVFFPQTKRRNAQHSQDSGFFFTSSESNAKEYMWRDFDRLFNQGIEYGEWANVTDVIDRLNEVADDLPDLDRAIINKFENDVEAIMNNAEDAGYVNSANRMRNVLDDLGHKLDELSGREIDKITSDINKLSEAYGGLTNNKPRVISVRLDVRNPLVVDYKGKEWDGITGYKELQKEAKAKGHDGIIIKNVVDGFAGNERGDKKPTTVYAVFDQKQIVRRSDVGAGDFEGLKKQVAKDDKKEAADAVKRDADIEQTKQQIAALDAKVSDIVFNTIMELNYATTRSVTFKGMKLNNKGEPVVMSSGDRMFDEGNQIIPNKQEFIDEVRKTFDITPENVTQKVEDIRSDPAKMEIIAAIATKHMPKEVKDRNMGKAAGEALFNGKMKQGGIFNNLKLYGFRAKLTNTGRYSVYKMDGDKPYVVSTGRNLEDAVAAAVGQEKGLPGIAYTDTVVRIGNLIFEKNDDGSVVRLNSRTGEVEKIYDSQESMEQNFDEAVDDAIADNMIDPHNQQAYIDNLRHCVVGGDKKDAKGNKIREGDVTAASQNYPEGTPPSGKSKWTPEQIAAREATGWTNNLVAQKEGAGI